MTRTSAGLYLGVFVCILQVSRIVSSTASSGGPGFSNKIDVRVINGWNARPHEFPWQTSLRIRRTNQHICGGSLISRYLVLTSAHCVLMNPCFTKYNVLLGSHKRNRKSVFQQSRKVKRWYIHSYFSHDHYKKDVALLFLDRPVWLTKAVHTIQLPPIGSRVAVGTNCYISGWGRTRGDGKYSNTLQKSHLTIIPYRTCAERNNGLFKVDYRSMVCARGRRRVGGGCKGDSGGPLSCWERRRWVLRGVVSWGHEGCSTHYYTVFARVSSLMKWIMQTAKKG